MIALKKERPTTVTILIDQELRDRLERSAAAHERSLGGEVRALLVPKRCRRGGAMTTMFDYPSGRLATAVGERVAVRPGGLQRVFT